MSSGGGGGGADSDDANSIAAENNASLNIITAARTSAPCRCATPPPPPRFDASPRRPRADPIAGATAFCAAHHAHGGGACITSAAAASAATGDGSGNLAADSLPSAAVDDACKSSQATTAPPPSSSPPSSSSPPPSSSPPSSSSPSPLRSQPPSSPILRRFAHLEGRMTHDGLTYTWLLVYLLINVVMWFWGFNDEIGKAEYANDVRRVTKPYLARSFGRTLDLNSAMVFLVGSRTTITYLRTTWLGVIVPFDSLMPSFHMMCALLIFIGTLFHALGNFITIGALQLLDVTRAHAVGERFYGMQGVLQLTVTGLVLMLVLIVMSSLAMMRGRHVPFEVFYYSHMVLAAVYAAALLIHGMDNGTPIFYKFGAVPLAWYYGDLLWRTRVFGLVPRCRHARLWRAVFCCCRARRSREGVDGKFALDRHNVLLLPGKVIRIEFPIDDGNDDGSADFDAERAGGSKSPHRARVPRGWWRAGQYAELRVPALSRWQWHPFTIASAPDDGKVVFMIKVNGNWTRRLHDLLVDRGCESSDESGDERANASGTADTESERSPRALLYAQLRGPFGAPSQDYEQFEHVVMVSGGIGCTPFCSIVRQICHDTRRHRARQLAAEQRVQEEAAYHRAAATLPADAGAEPDSPDANGMREASCADADVRTDSDEGADDNNRHAIAIDADWPAGREGSGSDHGEDKSSDSDNILDDHQPASIDESVEDVETVVERPRRSSARQRDRVVARRLWMYFKTVTVHVAALWLVAFRIMILFIALTFGEVRIIHPSAATARDAAAAAGVSAWQESAVSAGANATGGGNATSAPSPNTLSEPEASSVNGAHYYNFLGSIGFVIADFAIDTLLGFIVTMWFALDLRLDGARRFFRHWPNWIDLVLLLPSMWYSAANSIATLQSPLVYGFIGAAGVSLVMKTVSFFAVLFRVYRILASRFLMRGRFRGVRGRRRADFAVRRVDFIWVSPRVDDDEWLLRDLEEMMLDSEYGGFGSVTDGVHFRLSRYVTRDDLAVCGRGSTAIAQHITNGCRPPWEQVFADLSRGDEECKGDVGVFFCGPDAMARRVEGVMRKTLKQDILVAMETHQGSGGDARDSNAATAAADNAMQGARGDDECVPERACSPRGEVTPITAARTGVYGTKSMSARLSAHTSGRLVFRKEKF